MFMHPNNLLTCYKTEASGTYLDSMPPAYHTHECAELSFFQLSKGSSLSFLTRNLEVFCSYAFTYCIKSFSSRVFGTLWWGLCVMQQRSAGSRAGSRPHPRCCAPPPCAAGCRPWPVFALPPGFSLWPCSGVCSTALACRQWTRKQRESREAENQVLLCVVLFFWGNLFHL